MVSKQKILSSIPVLHTGKWQSKGTFPPTPYPPTPQKKEKGKFKYKHSKLPRAAASSFRFTSYIASKKLISEIHGEATNQLKHESLNKLGELFTMKLTEEDI